MFVNHQLVGSQQPDKNQNSTAVLYCTVLFDFAAFVILPLIFVRQWAAVSGSEREWARIGADRRGSEHKNRHENDKNRLCYNLAHCWQCIDE